MVNAHKKKRAEKKKEEAGIKKNKEADFLLFFSFYPPLPGSLFAETGSLREKVRRLLLILHKCRQSRIYVEFHILFLLS